MQQEYHDLGVSAFTFSRLLNYAKDDESDDDVIRRLLDEVGEKPQSLRGEIYSLLNHTYVDADWGTNQIMLKIEERIDEKIEEYKPKKYSYSTQKALTELKEMLK